MGLDWSQIREEFNAYMNGEEHACRWRADNELVQLYLRHPDSIRLKPLMLEIAKRDWPRIDYTKPWKQIYETLYFAAKVLYKERNYGRKP